VKVTLQDGTLIVKATEPEVTFLTGNRKSMRLRVFRGTALFSGKPRAARL